MVDGRCVPKTIDVAGTFLSPDVDIEADVQEMENDTALDVARFKKAKGKLVLKSRQTSGRMIVTLASRKRDDRINGRRGMGFGHSIDRTI